MKSAESDVGYFEVDAVFNRESAELLEESTWTAGLRRIARIRLPLLLLLSAGRPAIDRYLLLVGPTAANLQQRLCRCGLVLGQTDGQTYRYIDPAPYTMQAVPIMRGFI